MNSNFNIFALKNNYDSAIIGILGALLIFLFTRHGGIGLEPDSIVYLSTARSAATGGGFFEFEGIPVIDFPIGYPAFLGIIQFISRVDILQSAHIINMILYFILIYLSGCIINQIAPKNKWIKIAFLLLIVFSPTLLNVYTVLMSETLFLVMILLFFIALHQYGQKKTMNALLLVAVIAGLSCVVRYAGVTLVGAGGLMILFDKKLKIDLKIKHILIFGIIGIAFLVGNLLRNHLIMGLFTGDREKSLTSLFENIQNYASVFSEFFRYSSLPQTVIIFIGISFIIFYGFTFIRTLFKTDKYYNFLNICVAYFITYTIFILLSATFSRFETLNFRLLSPLYLACLLPFTFYVSWLISRLSGWKRYSLISVFILAFGGISYSQYKENNELYVMAKNSGIPGYAEECWRKSPILNYLNENKHTFKEGTRFYSDGNEAVYLFTGLRGDLVPHVESVKDNEEFKVNQKDDYYIAWFIDNEDSELLSLDTLLKNYKLTQVVSCPEGGLYFHKGSADEVQTLK